MAPLPSDVDSIEKIQRRMTRMIPELSQLNYDERLCRTSPLSLEMRVLADLIEVFNIVKGIDNVYQYSFFNPLEKQGLEDICINSSYPAVDLILEIFHSVIGLFLNGTVYHPKLSIR